jgi:hypothetical protein
MFGLGEKAMLLSQRLRNLHTRQVQEGVQHRISLSHGVEDGIGLEDLGAGPGPGKFAKLKRGTLLQNQRAAKPAAKGGGGMVSHEFIEVNEKEIKRSDSINALPMTARAMSNLDLFSHEQQQDFDTLAGEMVDDGKEFLSKLKDWLSRYDAHKPALDRHRKERLQVVTLIEKLAKELAALGVLLDCLTNADTKVSEMARALTESTRLALGLHPATAKVARLHEATLLSYSKGEVHMAGFLNKRGAGAAMGGKLSNTKYKKRWFSLEGTVLKYYKEQVGDLMDDQGWGRSSSKTGMKTGQKVRVVTLSKFSTL